MSLAQRTPFIEALQVTRFPEIKFCTRKLSFCIFVLICFLPPCLLFFSSFFVYFSLVSFYSPRSSCHFLSFSRFLSSIISLFFLSFSVYLCPTPFHCFIFLHIYLWWCIFFSYSQFSRHCIGKCGNIINRPQPFPSYLPSQSFTNVIAQKAL